MKKNILFILLIISNLVQLKATKINASTFGYNTTDATTALVNAINSVSDTVVVDYVSSGIWTVQPISFSDLSNKVIIFANNVQLVAKAGAFPTNFDCLFRLIRVNNVEISGYGATFKMIKSEYTTGEWRHTLNISNSSNIKVKGLTLKDSGGDGIFISGDTWFGAQLYSSNVYIVDCVCDNHKRQGMSVISAQDLTVENCVFKNTIGTLPEAGLDLEPDIPQHRLVRVLFKNCQFRTNNGRGIQLALHLLTAASLPVSITFTGCYLTANHTTTGGYQTSEISASSDRTSFPTGTAVFNNCTVENSQWTAFECRKAADSYSVTFNNSSFKNVSQTQKNYNNPIWLEVVDYDANSPTFGGVAFNNVCIEFPTQLAFIHANGWTSSTGLKNVTGNFGVTNSYQLAPVYSNVMSQNNVNVTFQQGCAGILSVNYSGPLSSKVVSEGILLSWQTASEMNNASFDIERSWNGVDFEKNGEVKGKGTTSKASDYAFTDKNLLENVNYYRLKQIDLDGRFAYSNVTSCGTNPKGVFEIFPNPVFNKLIINDLEGMKNIAIINLNGQIVKRVSAVSKEIDVQDVPKGLYFLEVEYGNQKKVVRKFLKL